MSQSQKNNGSLTAKQQMRKDVWSDALVAAGISPESMDWTQPEVVRPKHAPAPHTSLQRGFKHRV
jgi:hypothetical protein